MEGVGGGEGEGFVVEGDDDVAFFQAGFADGCAVGAVVVDELDADGFDAGGDGVA